MVHLEVMAGQVDHVQVDHEVQATELSPLPCHCPPPYRWVWPEMETLVGHLEVMACLVGHEADHEVWPCLEVHLEVMAGQVDHVLVDHEVSPCLVVHLEVTACQVDHVLVGHEV